MAGLEATIPKKQVERPVPREQPHLRLAGAADAGNREALLVQAAQAGDQQARAELLVGYERRLYTVCYRMLGDREEARDLTQEALMKIIAGLGGYDGRAAFSTWAIRVAMNTCLSHLRKQKLRRHASLEALEEGRDGESGRQIGLSREQSPGRGVELEQMRRKLQWALLQLDPQMRSVLVLRDIRGLDYEQIAGVEDIAVGTVKSRLFRARLALRQALSRADRGETREDDPPPATKTTTKRNPAKRVGEK
jgi:RNA polymerase sigma-70 factor, ECF subfamily